eukprot:COSAG02_NODE_7307_length_3073_cov_1.494620_2_plen_216_part_00
MRPGPEAWAKNQSLEHAELKYYDVDGHGKPGEEKGVILLGKMKTTSDDKAMTIELSGTSPDGEACRRLCAFNSRADYDDFLQVLEPELCSAKSEEMVDNSHRPRRGALGVVSVAHGDLAKDTTSQGGVSAPVSAAAAADFATLVQNEIDKLQDSQTVRDIPGWGMQAGVLSYIHRCLSSCNDASAIEHMREELVQMLEMMEAAGKIETIDWDNFP